MRDRQDIFIEIVQRLCAQGKRSSDGIVCMYRGPDGTKSPSGWLIPEEIPLDPHLNIRGLGHPQILEVLRKSGINIGHYPTRRMLVKLQRIHDIEEVEDWPDHLIKLARNCRLDSKVVYKSYGLPG